jgi:hypothetical protein
MPTLKGSGVRGDLVGGIDPEALDAGGHVRGEHGEVGRGDLPAFGDQFADHGHHVQGGVEDDGVGHQRRELQDLLLFGALVRFG